MKPLYERDTTRGRIQLFSHGCRRVVRGDRESWSAYLIIPRAVLVAGIRARRAAGAQYHDCDWWTLAPGLADYIQHAGCSGPGLAFASEPCRLRSARHSVVIAQHGGLDI